MLRNFMTFGVFILLALLIGISFHYWEIYLMHHYLGGYDVYGLPISKSLSGFDFFLKSWPLWAFPFCLLVIIMCLIYLIKKATFIEQSLTLKKKMDVQINALTEQQLKAHSVSQQLSHLKPYKLLEKKYKSLKKELFYLKKDYKQSLRLNEKLLEQLAKKDNKN